MKYSEFEKSDFIERLIQNCAVAVFAINAEHHVVYWNRACERLTGISARELLGTNQHWKAFYDHRRSCLSDIILDDAIDDGAEYYEVFGNSVLLPNGVHAEGWYPGLGGNRRYIIFDAAPVFNGSGERIAAVETLQDITERKLLEEEKERLIKDLKEASLKIKTLKGLIPICSTCKKIRDDNGYWNKLESYIEQHSGAEFTHGMCPACEERFYVECSKVL
jgi:transcriptional regulator with PAS, ATPase and Fis domain